MDSVNLFFILFISLLEAVLVYFKLRIDKQYYKDIPYMPKRYGNIITASFLFQIIGSVINLAVTPFPYSTAIIFVLLGINLFVGFVVGRKRSKIIEDHWKQVDVTLNLT